jgi:hypothetical protein
LDNVKDVTKTDLKNLKSELKLDEEKDLGTELTKLNDHVETFFN